MRVWWPEEGVKCPPPKFCLIALKQSLSPNLELGQRPANLSHPLLTLASHSTGVAGVCVSTPSFLCGSLNPNTVLYVYTASHWDISPDPGGNYSYLDIVSQHKMFPLSSLGIYVHGPEKGTLSQLKEGWPTYMSTSKSNPWKTLSSPKLLLIRVFYYSNSKLTRMCFRILCLSTFLGFSDFYTLHHFHTNSQSFMPYLALFL